MKKSILSIWIMLYMISSTGANLQLHYCMGQLASWSIVQDKVDHCPECGMAKSDAADSGCCTDQNTFVKNTHDQKPGQETSLTVPTLDTPVLNPFPDPMHLRSAPCTPASTLLTDVRSTGVPRYLFLSVFRI